jgi:hypothetical protein
MERDRILAVLKGQKRQLQSPSGQADEQVGSAGRLVFYLPTFFLIQLLRFI